LSVVERASGTSGTEIGALVSPARASEVFTLGGPGRLDPPPPPVPWRTWILWGVLCAGVVLLVWMVWRLARQMTPAA
jgi:hypothetical protein